MIYKLTKEATYSDKVFVKGTITQSCSEKDIKEYIEYTRSNYPTIAEGMMEDAVAVKLDGTMRWVLESNCESV